MWHMNDLGSGWWLLMSVGMVGVWGLIIYGVVWLARGASTASPAAPQVPLPAESPQEVLKRRRTAGDISIDEYERLRTVVDEGPAKPPPEPALR